MSDEPSVPVDTEPADAADPAPPSVAPSSDERLSAIEERLKLVESAADAAARQIALVPPQVRSLAGKLDGVATAISEPRVRDLLNGMLNLYDLTEQARGAVRDTVDDETHRRNYDVLRTQLRQILGAHGLSEIPADGAFDPQLHRALTRVPVDTPEQAGRIVQLLRAGFRTEQAILRYAEVAVGHYEPNTAPAPPDDRD